MNIYKYIYIYIYTYIYVYIYIHTYTYIYIGSSDTNKMTKPGLKRAEFRTQTNDSSYSELDDMILNGDTGINTEIRI
jgi:hypothetical protein